MGYVIGEDFSSILWTVSSSCWWFSGARGGAQCVKEHLLPKPRSNLSWLCFPPVPCKKPGTLACICNSRPPTGRWEADPEELGRWTPASSLLNLFSLRGLGGVETGFLCALAVIILALNSGIPSRSWRPPPGWKGFLTPYIHICLRVSYCAIGVFSKRTCLVLHTSSFV